MYSISLHYICCLHLNQMRKEIGFIKGSSRKQELDYSNSHNDSSDSFSSFDYDPRRDRHDEFSPYRHPEKVQKDCSNPSSRRVKVQPIQKEGQRSAEPPHFSNLILRNNFIQQNKEAEVNYSSSSQEDDPVIKVQAAKGKVLEDEKEYEEELSLSNIHKFQRVGKLDESKEQKGKMTKETLNRKYLEEDYYSSTSEIEQKIPNLQENKQEKKTITRRKPKQIEQQLITEYDKRQFKDKTMKRAILQHHNQNRLHNNKKNMLEAKGGICFQIDKTAFRGSSQAAVYPKKRKKKDSDPRLELIQRRQNARNYDRQCRSHLFGYY